MIIDKLLEDLTSEDFDNIAPFEPTEEQLRELISVFQKQGYKFSDLTMEAIPSATHKQFRRLDQGRGPFVVSVLGQEKSQALLEKCQELGQKYGGLEIGRHEGTEGRSLQQSAADLLLIAYSFAVSENPQTVIIGEGIRRLNRRAWRGHLRTHKSLEDQNQINGIFAEYGETPTSKTASIPPGPALYELWKFLTDKVE